MQLHGVPLSNYFNMVKHALLAKGLEFEEVATGPSQELEYLAKSPMGKVPMLETEQGCLTETDVIMAYLEETYPEVKLFPEDPFARAKVKQLMKTQELYVESPAHSLIGALFGRDIPPFVKAACEPDAKRGLQALGRLVNFGPYICGEDLSFADIFVFYSFTLSNRLTLQVFEWNMLEEVPGLADWYAMMAALPITQQVLADTKG